MTLPAGLPFPTQTGNDGKVSVCSVQNKWKTFHTHRANETQIFLNESEYFTRSASFLLKHTDLRGFTRVHPSCFRLGKVKTLAPSKSSLSQGPNLQKDKSISQVETSKACMSVAFWNEHTGEFNTTWFHSPGKLSVFVFLFYMKVASKLFKFFSLSQLFLPLGFQNTLWVFKIHFLVFFPPSLFQNSSAFLELLFPITWKVQKRAPNISN